MSTSGVFVPKGQGTRCKGQVQHQRKSEGMQQQHATLTPTPTDQLRVKHIDDAESDTEVKKVIQ